MYRQKLSEILIQAFTETRHRDHNNEQRANLDPSFSETGQQFSKNYIRAKAVIPT
jgi:hypothetical protein